MEASSRTRRERAPALVVVGGLLVLALAVAFGGLRSERHTQGTNHVRAALPVVQLAAGQTACQRGELVPAGTGGVRLWVTGDGSPFSVAVGGARAERAAGWVSGPVDVDLPKTTTARRDVPVCVTNGGPGMLTLAGDVAARAATWAVAGAPAAATIGAVAQPGRARIDYL